MDLRALNTGHCNKFRYLKREIILWKISMNFYAILMNFLTVRSNSSFEQAQKWIFNFRSIRTLHLIFIDFELTNYWLKLRGRKDKQNQFGDEISSIGPKYNIILSEISTWWIDCLSKVVSTFSNQFSKCDTMIYVWTSSLALSLFIVIIDKWTYKIICSKQICIQKFFFFIF